jgi:Matrixin
MGTVLAVFGRVIDVIGFIVGIILSIPIIGGILRTILNWATEIVWRVVGFIDFLGSLVGIRLRKRMYFGVVVPSVEGTPIISDSEIQRQVDAAIDLYDRKCKIKLIFTGIRHTKVPAPAGGLSVGCDASGFFGDWWIAGSYFEFASTFGKYPRSFRRVIGHGAELIVFIVQDVTPTNTNGCSFGSTHNWVVVEAKASDQSFVAAHEMGHACWLGHRSDANNLMSPSTPTSDPELTFWQISLIRWSKHCVYI